MLVVAVIIFCAYGASLLSQKSNVGHFLNFCITNRTLYTETEKLTLLDNLKV